MLTVEHMLLLTSQNVMSSLFSVDVKRGGLMMVYYI